tara:strand:- start:2421 stop:2939 length:519 start_codon:yes stop_codon:yes gene_type:complete
MSINNIVKGSIFCALAIGLGFVFMPVPNFELITVTVFLSGLYLNSAWGFLIGCTTIMIYSGFNPMGSGLAFPPLFLSQTIAMGFIGLSGGLMKFSYHLSLWSQRIVFCLAGFFLTLVYDIVTLFAYPLALGLGDAGLIGILIKGLPFIIFHEFINSIIFLIFVPKVFRKISR